MNLHLLAHGDEVHEVAKEVSQTPTLVALTVFIVVFGGILHYLVGRNSN